MVLDKLGSNLYNAIQKIIKAPVVDEATVKELVKDFQRALLQADVNVALVMELSQNIQKNALDLKLPPGISRREHIIKVINDELTNFVGENPQELKIVPGKQNVLMLIGIQGSGKTTHSSKLARYFQKRGLKVGVICADTFRPGAYSQLKQLAESINVPFYGEPDTKDPVALSKRGVEHFKDTEIVILDTSGRHKEETALIKEMQQIEAVVNPHEVILVLDGTIGQQATAQASAFKDATEIGSIIVSKLDGTARGGGALSGVAATGAPIKFIGTGEKVDDLEAFVPSRFIGRLLGMGDIEGLIAKVKEAESPTTEKDVMAMMSGKFSIQDMYNQFEAMQNMGPLQKVLGMIPGMSYQLPKDEMEGAEGKLEKFKVIIQSMTQKEKDEPKTLNRSRIQRVARGSGTDEREVRELIKQYNNMRKMLKQMKGSRRMRRQMPFKM
ncbi:signal recognition particle protein [Candidatus Bathyarchaeota archaeon]|jgi:signal recognition particle subunit SRP54|nr:signal recognition particle protein [Candidatus Bathyarchaeota archaeon]MBT4320103.1 signal recognition particle protein [Candidatus Bathyarchaeota archaeon]MBT4424033.1 signal recognition particle protein [Candidatus Bathyarchaeota archaeon]MBT5641752.1 signal recognition particle protein [Candidatus Bathyarchaeota archaeon]MBT6603533.1 signal recognition particle protein [Candidatus Bathyarchaeota archaeon]